MTGDARTLSAPKAGHRSRSARAGRQHGARRRAAHEPRRHPHAGLHAGRHARRRQRDAAEGARGGRRRDRRVQRVSPGAGARPLGAARLREPAQVHGLAARDPDRLGRLPGLPAGEPGGARRGRGVSRCGRRQDLVAAGGCDRHPGGARLGFRHAARRMHRAAGAEGQGAGGARAHPGLGAALARCRQGSAAGPDAVRHRPGRDFSRPARAVDPRTRPHGIRRLCDRRPQRRRDRKKISAKRSTSRSATCRTSGRAT